MRRITVEFDLPEEVVGGPDGAARFVRRVREGVVLDLLRRGVVSQGKAAELLGLDRFALTDLLAARDVPFFNLDGADFDAPLDAVGSGGD